MYNCVELKSLEDYFKDYNQREQKGVYFIELQNIMKKSEILLKNIWKRLGYQVFG